MDINITIHDADGKYNEIMNILNKLREVKGIEEMHAGCTNDEVNKVFCIKN